MRLLYSSSVQRVLKLTLKNGRFENVSPVRSQAMRAVKGKNNSTTEIAFRMALIRAGIRGWRTGCCLPGKPDVFFPEQRLAVFLDGCFWHGCPACGHIPKTNSGFWQTKISLNRRRDRKNTRILRNDNWRVLRIWEHSLSQKSRLQRIVLQIKNKFSYGNEHVSKTK